MDNGFIVLHRKILNHPLWKHSSLSHLFMHLLLKASHSDQEFIFNGESMTLKRGQVIIGRFALAKELGQKAGSLRNRCQTLAKMGIITIKSNNKFSLITIVKYSQYQTIGVKVNTKKDNERTSNGQQSTTYNNDNNVNNILPVGVDGISSLKEKEGNEINTLLAEFKRLNLNPHINFANKTERSAAEKLIKTYGLDVVMGNLKYIAKLQAENTPYLPAITTALDLYNKWAKLIIFFKRKDGNET
jgi:hypothetical protein